jgi:signal transduction histidine kinase
LRVLNRLIVALCLWFGMPCAHALSVLTQATVESELAGSGAPSGIVQTVLPYHWDQQHGGHDGRARFGLTFSGAETQLPQAIYIGRIGNTFSLTLNGVLLAKLGRPGGKVDDFAKRPRFFPIPSALLRAQNTLIITIEAQAGRNGGLGIIMLGPVAEIRAIYAGNYRWRVTGMLVISVISAVLGGMALLLWFRQRERLYLLYGLSELLWAVYAGDTLIEHPPLPWPWWGVVYFVGYGVACVLIAKFCLLVMDLHQGRIKLATDWILYLTLPMVLVGLFGGAPWLKQLWSLLAVATMLYIALRVVQCGLRSAELQQRVLAVGVLVMAVAALRDLMVLTILPYTGLFPSHANHFGSLPWQRYAWLVFGISLAWIIAEQMRRSTRDIGAMNQVLARRLAEREAELRQVFGQQSDGARQQAMLEERQRLTRDMHDGLGSHLLGALNLAQDPAATRGAVARQLRETLDQLKLTVDAMQDTEGDIGALLGALRYRLGPRLTAAGVTLAWSVGSLPTMAGWTLQNSRDLQMILFEVISNLIAHAGASDAGLCATHDVAQGVLRITLHDNGCGFVVHGAPGGGGHGIENMRFRATRINAALQIDSTPCGTATTLTLTLPALLAHEGADRA